MIDVCVAIVAKNHRKFIKTCINSLLNSAHSFTVITYVVDDGSIDGTLEILESYSDRIKLIKRDGSHSFSSNNNIILKNVEAKYFLVINPDTIIPKDGISKLYYFMETHNKVGACCPKLVFPDGSLQLSCRRFPTPLVFLLRRTPLRVFLPERKKGDRHLMINFGHDEIIEVDWALGACIMLRGEALNMVGYFDERFRLYVEDIDLCYRLWQNGWMVYYNPNVVVVHNHNAKSDKNLFSKHSFWHYKSMFYYIIKHGFCGFKRPKVSNIKFSP